MLAHTVSDCLHAVLIFIFPPSDSKSADTKRTHARLKLNPEERTDVTTSWKIGTTDLDGFSSHEKRTRLNVSGCFSRPGEHSFRDEVAAAQGYTTVPFLQLCNNVYTPALLSSSLFTRKEGRTAKLPEILALESLQV